MPTHSIKCVGVLEPSLFESKNTYVYATNIAMPDYCKNLVLNITRIKLSVFDKDILCPGVFYISRKNKQLMPSKICLGVDQFQFPIKLLYQINGKCVDEATMFSHTSAHGWTLEDNIVNDSADVLINSIRFVNSFLNDCLTPTMSFMSTNVCTIETVCLCGDCGQAHYEIKKLDNGLLSVKCFHDTNPGFIRNQADFVKALTQLAISPQNSAFVTLTTIFTRLEMEKIFLQLCEDTLMDVNLCIAVGSFKSSGTVISTSPFIIEHPVVLSHGYFNKTDNITCVKYEWIVSVRALENYLQMAKSFKQKAQTLFYSDDTTLNLVFATKIDIREPLFMLSMDVQSFNVKSTFELEHAIEQSLFVEDESVLFDFPKSIGGDFDVTSI